MATRTYKDVNELVTLKLRVFNSIYGEYRKAYEGQHDDRGLYCNMFDIMTEALEAMRKVKNNTIWVAFNHHFREEQKTMCEIVKHFEGHYPMLAGHEYTPDKIF